MAGDEIRSGGFDQERSLYDPRLSLILGMWTIVFAWYSCIHTTLLRSPSCPEFAIRSIECGRTDAQMIA